MAKQHQLDILRQGIQHWNQWREQHPNIIPRLTKAPLKNINLSRVDLSKAVLNEAQLNNTNFRQANLCEANLIGADLSGVSLMGADLTRAKLSGAQLVGADLQRTDFTGADLSGANLSRARLNGTVLRDTNLFHVNLTGAKLEKVDLNGAILNGANLSQATLLNCFIYGISAWNVRLEGTKQANLIITQPNEPTITVESLSVAQFIYLLLNNREIRDVANAVTSKVVLILGRFTPERKQVLDAIREELGKQNYVPVLFDFEKPSSRDFTETVSMLAHLSRFIVADLTDPSSIPQELQAIVPLLAVPVQPLLHNSKKEYSLFKDLWQKYPWVLPIYRYGDRKNLLPSLKEAIINPAEKKAKELERWRR